MLLFSLSLCLIVVSVSGCTTLISNSSVNTTTILYTMQCHQQVAWGDATSKCFSISLNDQNKNVSWWASTSSVCPSVAVIGSDVINCSLWMPCGDWTLPFLLLQVVTPDYSCTSNLRLSWKLQTIQNYRIVSLLKDEGCLESLSQSLHMVIPQNYCQLEGRSSTDYKEDAYDGSLVCYLYFGLGNESHREHGSPLIGIFVGFVTLFSLHFLH